MKRVILLVGSLIGIATLVACGDDTSGSNSTATGTGTGGSTGSGGSPGTGGGDPTPAESCVQKGEHGNDKGVGEYCTPGGGECSDLAAGLCLADLGAMAEGQWWCTKTCTTDADCGEEATCRHEAAGSGCSPNKCQEDGSGGAGGTTETGASGTGGSGTGGAGGA